MNFEDLRNAWQCQKPRAKLTVNSEALLREVQLLQRMDKVVYLLSDIILVAAYAIMVPVFVYPGIRYHSWTFYLMASACFFIAIFIPFDRWRQRRQKPLTKKDSLASCLKSSLLQVTHEIWRSKNIFWWYLAPLEIGFAATTMSWAGRARHGGWTTALEVGTYALFCALLGWGTYWLSQYTVRKTLEPRRRELEQLLASVNEDSPNASQPMLAKKRSNRKTLLLILLLLVPISTVVS